MCQKRNPVGFPLGPSLRKVFAEGFVELFVEFLRIDSLAEFHASVNFEEEQGVRTSRFAHLHSTVRIRFQAEVSPSGGVEEQFGRGAVLWGGVHMFWCVVSFDSTTLSQPLPNTRKIIAQIYAPTDLPPWSQKKGGRSLPIGITHAHASKRGGRIAPSTSWRRGQPWLARQFCGRKP